MKLNIYNIKGNILNTVDIKIFDLDEIRYDLIYQIILWQCSYKRISISHTKEISFVKGSTKKIYRQKGTGKARHGSNRRALFRGGCVTFGPSKKKNYFYKLNKKLIKLALLHSLASKIFTNSIIIYNEITINSYKTKEFINLYNRFLHKRLLFIDNNLSKNFFLAHRNIPNVHVINISQVNVLELIKNDVLIISLSGIRSLINNII